MAATSKSSSGILLPCGHVHQVTISSPANGEKPASTVPVVVFQVDGCELAAAWGNSLLPPFVEHIEKLDVTVRKGEERTGRLWKDLEMAFGLVREFGGLYQVTEKKRVEAVNNLAALRSACDCWWGRPILGRRRAAHRHHHHH